MRYSCRFCCGSHLKILCACATHLAATSRIVNPPGKQLGTIIQNVVEAWQAEDYVKNLTANVKRGWQRIMKEAANGRVLTRRVPKWLWVVDRTYSGAKIINPGRIVEVPDKVAVTRWFAQISFDLLGLF